MIREYLFRGKRVDNGEWVEGHLIQNNDDTYIADKMQYSHIGYCNDCDRPFDECYIVKTETVGQYTGLTDKNGQKIFEGDILESRASENKEDWKVWQVGFEDGSFVFDSVRKSIKSRRKFKHEQNLLCACEIDFYGLVKIGNIHDNPELLEEG